jgi:superfamily II DNA or RNA helicase
MSDNESDIEEQIGYPNLNDPDLQYKLYKKREFYANRIPERPELTDYKEIEEYRKSICRPIVESQRPHQAMLANYINPNTPMTGLLLFHGVGSGKCVFPTTNIYIDYHLHTIEEVWNTYKTDIIKKDGGEWSKLNENIYTLSYNENDHMIEPEKIIHLYREYVDTNLMKITFKNNTELIKTFSHKIYSDKKWKETLNINDIVSYCDNHYNIKNIEVVNIEIIEYKGYVYDLEVDFFHNYLANDIVTHNTCAAISIAENFISLAQKYKTKIHVLVPGPIIKENWKNEIIKKACTGNKYYLTSQDKQNFQTIEDEKMNKLRAISIAMNYYKIMSYKGFYKRVLGDKIIDKKIIGKNRIKTEYRKNKFGDFEREHHGSPLTELNNTLLIVDEAHNLLGSNISEALELIIKNSVNLKILLLTATPMSNSAVDIIGLINFLRPISSPVEKDKIFTNTLKVDELELKTNGLEYLKKMTSGYVSYLRGADPLTFATQKDQGKIPKELSFTKLVSCEMDSFQQKVYDELIKSDVNDALSKKSSDVSNIVFPILNEEKNDIIGAYGKEGINTLISQLKNNSEKLNKLICKKILKLDKTNENIVSINNKTKGISGMMFNKEYLKYFSTKFYQALIDIENNLFENNDIKSPRNGFVYCNLVKNGIDIFQEILLQNGYLEYDQNMKNYDIKDNTVCYHCGKQHNNHDKEKHPFYPATFLKIIGKVADEEIDVVTDESEKFDTIKNVFNNISNKNGKFIKLILGSRVINEGITLKNVYSVQILDVHYHFGRVEQVIGRSIRWCVHYDLMSKEDPNPEVKVFKYAIALKDGKLSTDEELYKKAEKKYLLIKKVERGLKENAMDCPLNYAGNVFKEEVDKYKNCSDTNKKNMCPAQCDFTDCDYKCDDKKLNLKLYDPSRKIYKKLDKNELDYSTFTVELAKNEINYAKEKIKEMYVLNYIYDLKTIMEYIYNSIEDKNKKELYDDFFIYKALDDLIPITQNDFNNLTDFIYDKTNKKGYLIYIDKYYLFQPFTENENVPVYVRIANQFTYESKFNLSTFLKLNDVLSEKKEEISYDFESVFEYYNNRIDNFVVGVMDQQLQKGKKSNYEDVFKLRDFQKEKQLHSTRESGTTTFFGAICNNSKTKEELLIVCEKLKAKDYKNVSRNKVCDIIMKKLYDLEKYSTGKDKKNYLIVPLNHPLYPFPLNLEDRVEYVKNEVNKLLDEKMKFKVINKDNKEYIISFKQDIPTNSDLITKLKDWEHIGDTFKMTIN